jgi:hypothetical protein
MAIHVLLATFTGGIFIYIKVYTDMLLEWSIRYFVMVWNQTHNLNYDRQ